MHLAANPEPQQTSFRAAAVTIRNLLVTAHAVQHIFSMALPTLLIFMRQELGYSYTQLGLIAAAASVTGGIMQYPAGLLADRFGSKQLLVTGYALTLSGLFLLSLSSTLPLMLLAQIITGLGNATFHPASFPAVARATRQTGLGMGMALHNMGGIFGGALSYSLVAVLATWLGWRPALRVMVAVGVMLSVYFAFRYFELPDEGEAAVDGGEARQAATAQEDQQTATAEKVQPAASQPAWRRWAPVLLVTLASFLAGAFGEGLMTFLPTFVAARQGATAVVAGMLSTLMLLAGTAGSFVGGKLADRYDRTVIIFTAAAGTAALILFLVNAPLGALSLALLLMAIGFVRTMTRPPFHAIVSQVSPGGRAGTAFGLSFGGAFLGGAVGNPLVGYVADHGSLNLAFAVIAGIYLLHGLLIRGLGVWYLQGRARRGGAAADSSATGT